MKKTILLFIAILIVVFGLWTILQPKDKKQDTNLGTQNIEAIFTDPSSKESVTIVFDQSNDTATLSGLGYGELALKPAVSASGARYLDATGDLEVWNRGEQVTISKNGKQIFFGNIGGNTDREKLEANTWVWLATMADGKAIEPKNSTAFTITFNASQKTLNATTDCNSIFGPYTIDENNSLTFGSLGMTEMYCEGSQEADFAEGLSKVKSFTFNGSGALVLEFASGSGSMLFGKK